MDSHLSQLLALLANAHAEHEGSNSRRGSTAQVERLLHTAMNAMPFRWSVYTRDLSLVGQVQMLAEHLRAFEGQGSACAILSDAEHVLAWYQKLVAGEIQLVGALREGPHRDFQRLL